MLNGSEAGNPVFIVFFSRLVLPSLDSDGHSCCRHHWPPDWPVTI